MDVSYFDSKSATPSATSEGLRTPHSSNPYLHRLELVTERILGQVTEWLQREKIKKEKRKSRRQSRTPRDSATANDHSVPAATRRSTESAASDSSSVSLDRLQKIVDENVAALGLNPTPGAAPRLTRKSRKKSSRDLYRAASSDTEWVDDDVVVPSCEAVLDNSKALGYTGGQSGADDSATTPGRKEKDRQNWITFKNEIIRLAHTLRLKGWRRVPLNSGETISVERLSGALTNAVYVVSPPPESVLPREPGKSHPSKVLLRIYGPQVDHLIDRENELSVLRRLARKKIGPRLLGTFLNGRFEQYLNATPLTPNTMREPNTSKQIAKRMRELHDGVELLEEERNGGPAVWKNWDKWLRQVEKTVQYLDKEVVARPQSLPGGVWKTRGFVCGVPWPVFKGLVEKYREHLNAYYGDAKNIRDKLVFAHNDVSSYHFS
jgi:choline kinase